METQLIELPVELQNVYYWYWWIFAAVLLILEIILPGVFFIWLSIAAAMMGGILLLFPELAFPMQLLIFSVLSLATVIAVRLWLNHHPITSDAPFLNQRLANEVGRTFSLRGPIVDGVGKIKIDDTVWSVHGPDLPDGSKVRVVAVEGMKIQVEAIKKSEGDGLNHTP